MAKQPQPDFSVVLVTRCPSQDRADTLAYDVMDGNRLVAIVVHIKGTQLAEIGQDGLMEVARAKLIQYHENRVSPDDAQRPMRMSDALAERVMEDLFPEVLGSKKKTKKAKPSPAKPEGLAGHPELRAAAIRAACETFNEQIKLGAQEGLRVFPEAVPSFTGTYMQFHVTIVREL